MPPRSAAGSCLPGSRDYFDSRRIAEATVVNAVARADVFDAGIYIPVAWEPL
jgi:hypothetical protein